MDLIRSRSNSKVRSARTLRQRKLRDESGTFLAEGIHLVGAAVEAGVQIDSIFFAPDLLKSKYALDLIEESRANAVPCYPTTSDVFTSLASKEHPQGIVAVVHQSTQQLFDLNPETFSWGAACIAPQDPGNTGTILRTIDAVGASGIILLDGGVDAYHPTAVRASMGAIFRHPVVSTSFMDFAQWAEVNRYQVVGTSAHASLDYKEITHFTRPLILLLGEERQGLTSEQERICDVMVRLPMHGKVTSLNLAVAAGIMFYDILAKIDGESDTG
jgi:TrmH family RNA methyltransferase